MTTILADTDKALAKDELQAVSKRSGPFLSVFLPPFRPGAGEKSAAQRLKEIAQTASELIEHHKLGGRASDFRVSLAWASQQPEMDAGGPSRVIFVSSGNVSVFRAPIPLEETVVLGEEPNLKPLISFATSAQEIFGLGLSVKQLRLWRYRSGECEAVPLPAGVPPSLEAAGGFDQPDHDLVNRSYAGHTAGAMRGVRFGTLSDRESRGEYLAHFYKLVHRGLRPALDGAPLLLIGLPEDTSAYRRVAADPYILENQLEGSAEAFSLGQIAESARAAALHANRHRADGVLAAFLEMTDRGRTLHHADEILRAAVDGRVHQLLFAEDMTLPARRGLSYATRLLVGEDLLNAAIVRTIGNGGEAFGLPGETMGRAAPMAAILRY